MAHAANMRRWLFAATGLAGATLALAGVAAAAAPVSGSVAGPVVSVGKQTFTITTSLSPTGKSAVHVGAVTTITAEESAGRADLQTGVCVVAMGTKTSKGVAATRVSLSQAVKGTCTGGFGGGRRGTPPPGGSRPVAPPTGRNRGGFANFAFAAGAITAVKGSTFTVHSARNGTSTVTISAKTQFTKTVRVGADAVKVKECAFVFGTSTDKGVTVTAQRVTLTQPVSGGCATRFRRP